MLSKFEKKFNSLDKQKNNIFKVVVGPWLAHRCNSLDQKMKVALSVWPCVACVATADALNTLINVYLYKYCLWPCMSVSKVVNMWVCAGWWACLLMYLEKECAFNSTLESRCNHELTDSQPPYAINWLREVKHSTVPRLEWQIYSACKVAKENCVAKCQGRQILWLQRPCDEWVLKH